MEATGYEHRKSLLGRNAVEERKNMLTLTADVVSAHVSNNSVSVSDLPRLIEQVHAALAGLSQEAAPEPEAKREPVVGPKASVKPDHLVCMVCGAKQKTLKRHLQTAHQMSPEEYRSEFSLKPDYPMVAPEYAQKRRELAKSIGLGNRGRKKKKG